jgi:hypothetical protein
MFACIFHLRKCLMNFGETFCCGLCENLKINIVVSYICVIIGLLLYMKLESSFMVIFLYHLVLYPLQLKKHCERN